MPHIYIHIIQYIYNYIISFSITKSLIKLTKSQLSLFIMLSLHPISYRTVPRYDNYYNSRAVFTQTEHDRTFSYNIEYILHPPSGCLSAPGPTAGSQGPGTGDFG